MHQPGPSTVKPGLKPNHSLLIRAGREGGLSAWIAGLKSGQKICNSGQIASCVQTCPDTHPSTFHQCVCFLPCGNSGLVDLAIFPGSLRIQPSSCSIPKSWKYLLGKQTQMSSPELAWLFPSMELHTEARHPTPARLLSALFGQAP